MTRGGSAGDRLKIALIGLAGAGCAIAAPKLLALWMVWGAAQLAWLFGY